MKKVHDFNVNYILKEKIMNKKNLLLSMLTMMSACMPQTFANTHLDNQKNRHQESMSEIIAISSDCTNDLKGLLTITKKIKNHSETPKGWNRLARSFLKKTPCLDAVYSVKRRTKIAITFLNNLIAAAESHNIINDEISHANLTKQITDTIERLKRLNGTTHKCINHINEHNCAHTHGEDLNKLYTTLNEECNKALKTVQEAIEELEPHQKWLTQK